MLPLVLAVCCKVSGNVRAVSGAPLANVGIVLKGSSVEPVMTDAKGDFSVLASPGSYQLTASVRGYAPVTVAVKADHDVKLEVALEPLDSPKLRQIGQVSVDGRLTPIQGTIPSVSLSRADFDLLEDDRIIDGLQTLAGTTFARPDGGAASAVVALRGPDPSESLLTLDGQLLNDGNTGDLDLSRLPVAAFSGVDVTEGLGPEDANGSSSAARSTCSRCGRRKKRTRRSRTRAARSIAATLHRARQSDVRTGDSRVPVTRADAARRGRINGRPFRER